MPKEPKITHEVTAVPLQIYRHHKELDLDAFRIATYNVILGLP